MKVKIINSSLEDYEREFKLRRMNYDQVVVNYPGEKGIKVFQKEEVEFITETEVDEFLINEIGLKRNDYVVITGSAPNLITGRTNFVRVHKIGT